MRRALKLVAVFAALLVVALVVLVKFQAYEEKYVCEGQLGTEGDMQPATIGLKFQIYQLAKLWAKSDGNVWIEIPNKHLVYLDTLEVSRTQWRFHFEGQALTPPFGYLSRITDTAEIGFRGHLGVFDGTCSESPS